LLEDGCRDIDPAPAIFVALEMSRSKGQCRLKQSADARMKMTDAPYGGPRHALTTLTEIFACRNIEGVWSNGPSFDQAILENLYHQYSTEPPWKYNAGRDFRTMRMLAPNVESIKPAVAHDAEADARAQAQMVQKIYAALPDVFRQVEA